MVLIPLQDKILQSFSKNEEIQVTNDGATILKSIGVDNPAAKILVGKNSKYWYLYMENKLQCKQEDTTVDVQETLVEHLQHI